MGDTGNSLEESRSLKTNGAEVQEKKPASPNTVKDNGRLLGWAHVHLFTRGVQYNGKSRDSENLGFNPRLF